MLKNLYENWLTDEIKKEVINLFQPSYDHPLTETEVIDIANALTNSAEMWIKFNWRINRV